MRKLPVLLAVLFVTMTYAQNPEEVSVKRVIDLYFDGLNERDSVKIKLALSENVRYQTIDERFGKKVLKDDNLSEVIASIVTIPKTTKFELKRSNVTINTDKQIANVWVTAQFYLYGAYYQCGSSSFQLFKENGDWKIISLLDNYAKGNCLDQE